MSGDNKNKKFDNKNSEKNPASTGESLNGENVKEVTKIEEPTVSPKIENNSKEPLISSHALAKKIGLNDNYIFVIKRKHSATEMKTESEWKEIFKKYNFVLK